MKLIEKIVGIIFLTIVYCHAIFQFINSSGIFHNSPQTVSAQENQIDFVSNGQSSIDFSINQLTTKSIESNSTSCNSLFFTAVFQPEKDISSATNQYSNRSKTRTIRTRKSDLIFPFHYHW